jgi:F420-dependent oxidoreductase-like protein
VRLGLFLGYQAGSTPASLATPGEHLGLARAADDLGYDSLWVAEAYGSDAPSLLGWLAGQTRRIGLGAAVMQIPGRSPALTAMTAATLDMISGGRFRLGLGVSGPQVSEGWHGVRFDAPLARTREYVEIVRLTLGRKPLTYDGTHYRLPLPASAGKALRLTVRPVQQSIPIYLAALGPKNVELAGEIADGWLAVFFSPDYAGEQRAALAAGMAKAGRDPALFDTVAMVPAVLGDDVARCADAVRSYAALYVGGMGSREQNFYNDLATRMGFGAAAREIQDLYLTGRHREAAAAVPLEFLDRTSLLGPVDRVADRIRAYAAAGVGTLAVSLFAADQADAIRQLQMISEAFSSSGLRGS